MVKINVLINDRKWKNFFNPDVYFKKKQNKLNSLKPFKKKIIFTVVLSNTKHLKKLNKKFRNKNKSTDVLSFPTNEKTYIGDIIINFSKVKKKHDIKEFKFEFDKLWIHGFLHLLGYNHKYEKDYYKMNKKEKSFLKLVN